MMNLKQIITSKIYTEELSVLPLKAKCIINTINPHSYCEAKKDTVFTKALLASDVLLPDGLGIVLAAKVLEGSNIKKIAGADIHQYLLEEADKKSQKVFYLGASENTLKLIEARIQKEFINIKVASFSPPFKPAFSAKDTEEMIVKVNAFQPTILFVGMTAPKQEKWVYLNKDKINANTIVSIGAVFDFYAGNSKRAPKWMIKLGLEWLHRSIGSWRLAKRNLISNPIFLKDLLFEKLI